MAGSARVPCLRRRPAGPGPRRHAGQRGRLRQSRAGHVRAKTGTYTVDNDLLGKTVLTAKALAGYMETASGRPLVFAFFVNNVPLDAAGDQVSEATAAAGRVLGRLCEVVYLHDAPSPSKPKADEPPKAASP